ncbi:MAG TPA: hypothetical protein VFA41_00280 [Ktedonobacteraceae bacterium]|jgi:Na+/phosphate symporter|nr:hypothetical protein [Ktedonobacteraceae bacterium]
MNQEDIPLDTLLKRALPSAYTESQGYDAPFTTFTWEEWLEMQAQTIQCFTRFQRAIQQKQAKVATQVAQEMIEIGMAWLYEAAGWIDIRPE